MSDIMPVIPSKLHELRAYRFRFSRNAWKHLSGRRTSSDDGSDDPPSHLRILTWNVDYTSPHPKERLLSALRHLEVEVLGCKGGEAPEPCCILLQEVNACVIPTLLEDEWVRENFAVAPISASKWPECAHYGLVTLVERSLNVVNVQLLEFGLSAMQRAGLMVDIALTTPGPSPREVTIRIINTHLESLPIGAKARTQQLSLLATFLKGQDVQGGIIAGDMNPIEPSDVGLASDLGLRDAWKKGDNDESGFTWGYQGGGDFPAARFDKILYLPRRGYKVDEPRRIGVGVKADCGGGAASEMWTSDHYGLNSELRLARGYEGP